MKITQINSGGGDNIVTGGDITISKNKKDEVIQETYQCYTNSKGNKVLKITKLCGNNILVNGKKIKVNSIISRIFSKFYKKGTEHEQKTN